ncbi:MAG TPA: carboxypeptidase-like regulatory domain-containing protein, partial [Pyrinomonadaceae bacterium]|nr:carboxypeptidase-like regulatory domain-containing protein [Pyrinomonadaceae bacterium]
VGAKLTAKNKSGEIFHAQTDEDGNYIFKLLPGVYEIEAEYRGFKKQIIKRFLLVNSTYGKISRDFVLESENSSECEPAGCLPDLQTIELAKSQVSDIILSRPLEELPKEQNKSKRKKKINKQ